MKMELTALILSQAKSFAVMLAAGILTESLWQGKRLLQRRIQPLIPEIAFWFAAAAVLSGFLYYCSYGKPSLHATIGFLIGLLLWKRILYYAILSP